MAGLGVTRDEVDTYISKAILNLRETIASVQRFKTWLDTKTDTELQSSPFNYTVSEVAVLRSATADLTKLGKITYGLDTQATAYDFSQFTKLLTGIK